MKWTIVTGDSGTLGHEIVKSILADSTYAVIGISRGNNNLIEDLQETHPNRYIHIGYDLLNVDGIKNLYLKEIKKIGPVYGLVNNSTSIS